LKRLIGMPGERIEIKNDIVFINGEEISTPQAAFDEGLDDQLQAMTADFGPLAIPKEGFFVLGDNRRHSMDSRDFGPVPFDNLHGTAKVIDDTRGDEQ
jgi:signal peptidase I